MVILFISGISIIVPVYNVEKYIRKCIESILKQTYNEYELILVDDGSTDNSGQICEEYSKNSKVKIYHKENGGLADARNYGLEKASGDYFTFIDSDDWIEDKYLETLLKISKRFDADLVISGFINVFENKEYATQTVTDIKSNVVSKEQCYRMMLLQDNIDVSATAKLYKMQNHSDLKFIKGQLYEDINIIDKTIESSNIIAVTTYKGYYYLQRQGSIMYGKFNEKQLSLLEATHRLVLLMKDKYPNNINAAVRRDIYCNFHLLGRSIICLENNKYSELFRDNIIKRKNTILFSKIYTKKEKLACILLGFGLKPYKYIWIKYKNGRI